MKILSGKRAGNFGEATILAFQEAGKSDMSPEVASLFTSVMDTDKLYAEAERSINTAIHNRYGRSATWYGKEWFIPLPQPRYDALPVPRMTFAVQGHLVAPITVETADNSYRATLVGPISKSEKLTLPISFLQAILDDDLAQFEIVGKDGKYTGWSVPGLRETLHLPNSFIAAVSTVLRLKSVGAWLMDFGSEGEAVAPLVVGSLLGLQFRGVTAPLPIGKQPFQREIVVDTLTGMFGSARAAEMFEKWAPYLKSSMTNEEAVSFILKETGRGN